MAIATLPEDNGRDLAPVDFERELATVEAGLTHILGAASASVARHRQRVLDVFGPV